MSDNKGICAMHPFTSRSLVKWLCGLIFICAFATAHAEDSTRNQLQRVEIHEGERATEIAVVGTAPPTFTVFKLSDPIRLFIDISNADASPLSGPIEIDNGVVSSITPLQFNDKLVSIGRLIVSLNKDALYSVKAVGNELHVKVDATERQMLQALSGPSAPALQTSTDAQILARAEAAERQAADLRAQADRAQQTAQTEAALRADAEARAQKAEENAAIAQQQFAENARLQEAAQAAAFAEAEARIARAEEDARKAQAQVAEAYRQAEQARQAEAAAQAQVQAKTQEVERLAQQGNDNARTQARLIEAEQQAEQARAQAAQARAQAEQAIAQAQLAEQQRAQALHEAEQAQAATSAEADARVARAEADAQNAQRLAAEAKRQAEQARQSESAAQALAQAKTQELARLQTQASNQAGQEAERTQARIIAAEKEAAEARAQALLAEEQRDRAEAASRAAEARAKKAEQNARLAENQADKAEQNAREAERLAQLKLQDAERQAMLAKQQARALENELKQAKQARLEAEARTKQAEARAQKAAQNAQGAQANATQLAEARAAAAEARAAEAEARAAEAEAEALAQNALSEASDREAESRVRHAESLAAQAQLQAEQQATAAQKATEAHNLALQRLQAAEARAAEAEAKANRANASQSERTKLAEQQAAIAEARAAEAEARAQAAEAQADASKAQADAALAQARAAKADQRRLAQEASAAQAQITKLEATQKDAQERLAQARAQKDASATAQLEAEKRAADAALQVGQARMQLLESAQQNAALNTRATELEEALRQARQDDQSGDVARLQKELAQLTAEAKALRKELSQRDTALAAAKKDADSSRKEAKRLQKALAKEKQQAESNYAIHPVNAPAAMSSALSPAQVTDVSFEDDDQGSRIRIALTGKAQPRIHREGERTRVLELDSALIDPAIERSLDTGDFDSAVRLVSSFQAPPPGDKVRIVVTLAENVDDQISTKQGELTWHFARPTSPIVASALPYAAPRAAAYTHLAAPKVNQGDTVNRLKTKHYTGRKINIDIKDGDIHNVLRLLAKEGNINIVTSDQVSGTVTLHLKLVPWDQVLDLVLKSKGLDMVREGDIVRIGRREDIHAEIVAEAEKNVVKEKLKPINIRLITASHASASDLVARVRSMMTKDRGQAEYDARTNTIILKDTDDVLDSVEDMIRRLDTQTPQVLIEARIVEVNVNESLDLGIQWGGDATFSSATGNATGLRFPSSIGIYGGATDGETPTTGVVSQPNFAVNLPAATGTGSGGAVGFSFGSIDSAFNLNVRLSASETEGTAKIVSSPKITTLDNVEATIMQGTSIPISQVSAAGVQTTFYDAVLKLTVKPTVTQDGNIYLNIRAENNTPDFQTVGARGDPTILKKEATTQLLLKDGDTTVIGGIYTSQTGHSRSAVPYLSHIPILGALFRNYSESDYRTELLVFVTPRIVNRAAATVRTTP